MNNKCLYYIAILGGKDPNIITRSVRDNDKFGSTIVGVEVFNTPFDAIRSLHEEYKRISPVDTVSIYNSYISQNDIITVDKNGESHIYATVDLTFNKVQDMVLGAVANYL